MLSLQSHMTHSSMKVPENCEVFAFLLCQVGLCCANKDHVVWCCSMTTNSCKNVISSHVVVSIRHTGSVGLIVQVFTSAALHAGAWGQTAAGNSAAVRGK